MNSTSDRSKEIHYNKLYNDIKYSSDPTPQYSPHGTEYHLTLRSLLGAETDEDDDDLYEDQLKHYKGPEGCHEKASDVHGYNVNVIERKVDKNGNMVITVENAARIEPESIKAAMNSPYWKYGIEQAVQAELDVMNNYNVFARDFLPKGRKPIGIRWVFKCKFENGVFVKWKARMCAKGYSLQPGLEYNPGETSSPVARSSTYTTCIAEAAHLGYHVKFFDIKSAYLLTAIGDHDLYCQLPPEIEIGLDPVKGSNCLKINYSIYGLPQSGRNHYMRFSKQLKDLGFQQSKVDPCLFTLRTNGEVMKLVLWVDDAMVTTSSLELWEQVKDAIDKTSPLSKFGDCTWLLGQEISQSADLKTIRVNQRSKIEALLERYTSVGNPRKTPLPPGWSSQEGWIPTTKQHERETVEKARKAGLDKLGHYKEFIHEFRSLLGALAHIALWCRIDIKQAVFLLARHQARPGIEHWNGLRSILKYLKGTKDLEMIYGSRSTGNDIVRAQVDSDYCGNKADTKSTTGYVIWVYGSVVYCESRKQRATTLSTTEAELVAASDCVKMLRYIRRLLTEDFRINVPTIPLGEDNQGCIHLAHDGGNWKRKRHIRVANSYLYEEVTIHESVAIRYVKSSENVADMMTKCLPAPAFMKHRDTLMGQIDKYWYVKGGNEMKEN